MEEKYTDLAVKLQEVESRSKSNEHRISNLEDDMDKMQGTQVVLVQLANGIDKVATQLVDMKSDIKEVRQSQDELTHKVTEIENRPANDAKKNMDAGVKIVAAVIITGLATFLLTQLFPIITWG